MKTPSLSRFATRFPARLGLVLNLIPKLIHNLILNSYRSIIPNTTFSSTRNTNSRSFLKPILNIATSLTLLLPLTLTLVLSLSLTSCQDDITPMVTDHSFSFSMSISQDPSSSNYFLTLFEDKGSDTPTEYTVRYSIDNNSSISLYGLSSSDDNWDTDGNGYNTDSSIQSSSYSTPLGPNFKLSSTAGDRHTFMLPEMIEGKHSIHMDIVNQWFSYSLSLEFETVSSMFLVHAEVDTSTSESSTLMVSLTKGAYPGKLYTIESYLDGNLYHTDSGVDFSETPLVRVPLGGLDPEEHTIKVVVLDGTQSKTVEFSFIEPMRYPTIDAEVSLSDGNLILTVSGNKYNSSLTVRSNYSIKGRCYYWEGGSIIYNDSPSKDLYYKSDIVTIQSLNSFSSSSDSKSTLSRRSSVLSELEAKTHPSAVWKTVWDTSGEGGYYSYVDFYQDVHYSLFEEVLSLETDFKGPEGVKLRVKTNLQYVYWNKHLLTPGEAYIDTPIQ